MKGHVCASHTKFVPCAACERHNETDKALDLLDCMHRAGFAASYANYSSIIMQVRHQLPVVRSLHACTLQLLSLKDARTHLINLRPHGR